MSLLSGRVDHLMFSKYLLFPEGIAQSIFFYYVHISTEEVLQLLAHIKYVPHTPGSIVLKSDEDIDIAIWAEILPQHRPKHRKFSNLPPLAKISNFFVWQLYTMKLHYYFPAYIYSNIQVYSIIVYFSQVCSEQGFIDLQQFHDWQGILSFVLWCNFRSV